MSLIRSEQIEQPVNLSGSFTGSLYGTASWAENAVTASYVNPLYQNVIITGSLLVTQSHISTVDYVDFSPSKYDTVTTNIVPAHMEGRVFYDTGSQALCVYNGEADITLEVGQEQWLRARNQTGVTVTKGSVVKLSGAVGSRPTITLAQSIDQVQAFGIDNDIIGIASHDIEQGTDGFITTFGILYGVNTANFSAGDLLWVSQSAGQFTNTPPSAPYDKTFVGVVTRVNSNNGSIFISPSQPIHFHDISSVSQSGNYTQGDLWTFKASGSSGVWTNTKTLSGSYTLSGSLTTNDGVSIQTLTASFISASGGITGSLFGTASFATTASYVIGGGSSGLTINSTAISSGTEGTILFQSASILRQNSNLYWDNANSRLGLGIVSPSVALDVSGAIRLTDVSAAVDIKIIEQNSQKILYITNTYTPLSSGSIYMGTGNATQFVFENSRFGINTNPGYPLHVTGTAVNNRIALFSGGQVENNTAADIAYFHSRASQFGIFGLNSSGNLVLGCNNSGTGNQLILLTNTNNVGVGGVTSPSAKVHIAAGTAAANTAPLKFTNGTLLTTAEDGAVEYNGSDYYTTVGTTRKVIFQANTLPSANYFTQYHKAGVAFTTGINNILMGLYAGYNMREGISNIAIGASSLYSVDAGRDNVAIGYETLMGSYFNSYNVAIGTQALRNFTTATAAGNSVAVGYRAGYGITTGARNIFLGFQAGTNVTTGSQNLIIGYNIDAPSAAASNQLSIGNIIFGTNVDGTGSFISTGNIGIGITSPSTKLDVSGSGRFTNGLTVTGSLVSTNLVVTTTGSAPSSPTTGSIYFDGNDKFYIWNGTVWKTGSLT